MSKRTLICGRAWVIPDNAVNTDAIMPRAGFSLSREQQRKLVLNNLRPGWSEQVEDGDVLIVGNSFGVGSSRPAVTVLQALGLRAIVAESFGEVFLRNSVSYAMPVLECPGVLGIVKEGDIVEVDVGAAALRNLTSGVPASGRPLPAMLVDVIERGGLYAILREQGFMSTQARA